MSINTLLSNTTILDELVNLIDAKSGNVASVDASGTYISIAPTTGNVKVGLAVGLPSDRGDGRLEEVEKLFRPSGNCETLRRIPKVDSEWKIMVFQE